MEQHELLTDLISGLGLSEVPEVVFHYTGPAGLVGIIRDRKIWATDIRYLNDAQEFEYTISLARTLLTDLKSRAQGSEDVRIFSECLTALTIAPMYRLYAASFSEHGNLLSQWRAYCPTTGGFSIGFSSKALNRSTETALVKCIYDEERQKGLLSKVMTNVLETWRPQLKEGSLKNDTSLPGVGADFLSALLVLAAVFKHPAFKEEAEWRLTLRSTLLGPPNPLFREGRGGIVPYTEFPLLDETPPLIDLVVVGPNPHADLALQAVDSFLQLLNVGSGRVGKSRIPYRTW